MHEALTSKKPPLKVTYGAVREWWKKYRVLAGSTSIPSADELQKQYGASIMELARKNASECKLCKALRERDPPICITDGVARGWLKKYGPNGPLTYIHNAGHLESRYGELIRGHAEAKSMDADALATWLRNEHSVSAEKRICQTWRKTQ